MELPRLLSELEPAPGEVKADYEDFFVEEVPLYEPSGSGTHTYLYIEKAGLSTGGAAHDIARALNLRTRDVGFAGLKDARAVTRQWFSVEHVDPAAVRGLSIPRLKVLEVSRHGNKLRIGHLRENKFVIKVRETPVHALDQMQRGLDRLAREGVPNYFGRQRFGARGDTWQVGRAILRRDINEAVDVLLGRPTDADYGDVAKGRELYEERNFEAAAHAWPSLFHNERKALKVMAKTGGNKKRAFMAIDANSRSFYVSAYQSYLFNQIVAHRLPQGLGTLLVGDLAWVHRNGAVFTVEDVAKEQPRADSLEISPSGPLFGYRMTQPTGEPGEMEAQLLGKEALPPDAFRTGNIRVKGMRRPLRFRPGGTQIELGADEHGAYLELRFVLPRGCYATSLLRELFSDAANLEPGGADAADEEPEQ